MFNNYVNLPESIMPFWIPVEISWSCQISAPDITSGSLVTSIPLRHLLRQLSTARQQDSKKEPKKESAGLSPAETKDLRQGMAWDGMRAEDVVRLGVVYGVYGLLHMDHGNMYIYNYIYIRTHIYIYIHKIVFIYVHTCNYIFIHIIHIYIYIFRYRYTYVYIICVYIYMYRYKYLQ